MRISFELEPDDLARFHEALSRAHRTVASADECDIVAAAQHALDNLPIEGAPGYVRKRLQQVARLIEMLEDEDWSLPQEEREDVARTLAYFSDPEDMIPDDVSVIGLLDDAIMLELLLRRLKHVLDAYDDFCAFRSSLGPAPKRADRRLERARTLSRRRAQLQARMRRRTARDRVAQAAGR